MLFNWVVWFIGLNKRWKKFWNDLSLSHFFTSQTFDILTGMWNLFISTASCKQLDGTLQWMFIFHIMDKHYSVIESLVFATLLKVYHNFVFHPLLCRTVSAFIVIIVSDLKYLRQASMKNLHIKGFVTTTLNAQRLSYQPTTIFVFWSLLF